MKIWCEQCRGYFDICHYEYLKTNRHLVGDSYGPTGKELKKKNEVKALALMARSHIDWCIGYLEDASVEQPIYMVKLYEARECLQELISDEH